MSYAPLHVHTEHSALDGLARLDRLADAAVNRGIPAMATTDHGSLSAIWEWARICRGRGIKPIPGMEAYVAIGSRHDKHQLSEINDEGMGDADDEGQGKTRQKKYHHLTMLAYNRTGWHNLIRLHNESQKTVWFKPRIDYELLKECGEGLIVTTGCLASPINSPLKQIDLVPMDNDSGDHIVQSFIDAHEAMWSYALAGDQWTELLPLLRSFVINLKKWDKSVKGRTSGEEILEAVEGIAGQTIIDLRSEVKEDSEEFEDDNQVESPEDDENQESDKESSKQDEHEDHLAELLAAFGRAVAEERDAPAPTKKGDSLAETLGEVIRRAGDKLVLEGFDAPQDDLTDIIDRISEELLDHLDINDAEADLDEDVNDALNRILGKKTAKNDYAIAYAMGVVASIQDVIRRQDDLYHQAERELEMIIDAVGEDNVYVEVMYHGIDAEASVIPYLRDLAEGYDLPVVATGDSHYIEQDEAEAHEAFLAVGTGARMDEAKRFKFNGGGYHLKSYEEMVEGRPFDNPEEDPDPADEWEQWWVDAVDNTLLIADRVEDDTVPEPQMRLPKFPVAEMEADDAAGELRLRVERGATWRYGEDWQEDHEIVDRIEHELNVIISMGFADYFLITQDVIEWCRSDRGAALTDQHPQGEPEKKTPIVVGAGRGSAAGAISSYCLGITGVEPLEPGLLFERFLEPGREGMPDIDIDFPASRRDEVFEYLQHRWGHDHTARIGSPTVAKTKAAIKDAARVLKPSASRESKLVYELGEKMAKAVPMDGASPMSFTKMDADPQRAREYFEIIASSDLEITVEVLGEEHQLDVAEQIDAWARSFELITKSPGIHPCGFVVSDEPLDDLIPLRQQKEGPQIACFNDVAMEDMGFLKMDILGLENLDYLSTAFNIVEQTTGERLTVDDLPYGNEYAVDEDGYMVTDEDGHPVYEDEGIGRAFGLVAQGRTAGLFQLESEGITQLSREVIPEDKSDLSAILALYRPGPMGEDLHHVYARRKNGLEEASYDELTSDEDEQQWLGTVLDDTHAVPVYQEQAMQLGAVVSGFDDKQRSVLRRAIGKKKKDLMDQCYTWWMQGAGTEVTNDRGEIVSPVFSDETAQRVWDFIKTAADYSFNKSHTYAYGHIAFWTAYLKQAYPSEYAAAVLAHAEKDEKRLATLNSLADEGIEVAAPDINVSAVNTTARDGVVYYGMAEVKRVGKIAQSIVDQRPEGGFESLSALREVRDGGRRITKAHLAALCDAGALDAFGQRAALHSEIHKVKKFNEDDDPDLPVEGPDVRHGQWVIETRRGKGDQRYIERTPVSYSPLAEAGRQLAVLGTILGDNPLDLLEKHHLRTIKGDIQAQREAGDDDPENAVPEIDGSINRKSSGGRITRLSDAVEHGRCRVLGMVVKSQVRTTRKGQKMAHLELLDGRRRLEVTVFPRTTEHKGADNIPDRGELAVVSGNIKEENGDTKLFASYLWAVGDPLDDSASEPQSEELAEATAPAPDAPKPAPNQHSKPREGKKTKRAETAPEEDTDEDENILIQALSNT